MPRSNSRRSGADRRVRDNLAHLEMDKMALKEGLQEWLDKKWDETCRIFGLWSIRTLGLLLFFAFIWLILKSQGWTFKP